IRDRDSTVSGIRCFPGGLLSGRGDGRARERLAVHLTGDIQAEGDSCHDDCYAEESDKHRNQVSGVWSMVVKAFHGNVSPRPETRFPWGRLPASLNLCASQIAPRSSRCRTLLCWSETAR